MQTETTEIEKMHEKMYEKMYCKMPRRICGRMLASLPDLRM